MSNNKPFSLADRFKSFKYAAQGIITFFRTEHNAWIHCLAAIIVIISAYLLKVTSQEWLWLALAITLVIITEMLNTAIEILCDVVSPEIHPQIKRVKDIAAGAVLVAAGFAIMIALYVFIPKFL